LSDPQGERSIFLPPYEGGTRRVTCHTVKILYSHPALEEINTHQSHPSQSPQTEFDTHLSCQTLKGRDLFFFLPTREDRGGCPIHFNPFMVIIPSGGVLNSSDSSDFEGGIV
jgi:hypothetical protein